ncbi:MAG: phosphatase PAP2 family protein [Candidatus Kapabacteria bacterium]|jgi:membrane-associated phospholipid phosphatase|nr:phosphatase PAP2 family protein [Candidatus Kapabacteria bacterium]
MKNKTHNQSNKFVLKNELSMPDIYTGAMLLIYILLTLVFFPSLENAAILLLINISLVGIVVGTAYLKHKFPKNLSVDIIKKFYFVPVILVIYTQIQSFLPAINPHDYDSVLIKWDFALFGVNPTEYLGQIANPLLTEYLQICYMSYFLMPLLHGIELWRRKDEGTFYKFYGMILFSFFISYLLYFIMPAIGPRFCLHDFAALNDEMPGLWLTESFRAIVNNGGGIPLDSLNPAADVNRDCMPSGHTMITLVNIFAAFAYRSKLRIPIAILGFSLIFGTVYLRYHYLVDVIAGIILAVAAYYIEPWVRILIQKRIGKSV